MRAFLFVSWMFLVWTALVTAQEDAVLFHVMGLATQTIDEHNSKPLLMAVELLAPLNQVYPMEMSPETPLLHRALVPIKDATGHAIALDQLKYRYMMVDPATHVIMQSETFFRTYSKEHGDDAELAAQQPYHEVFNRTFTQSSLGAVTFNPMTNTDLFPIGLDRAPSKLHRYNEIPTLHFTANPTDVANMHNKYNDDIEIKGNLTFIRATKVKQFGNVTLSIGGRSSRQFTKMPYNFDLNHGDDLGGYRKLKLRTLASDPSYIRERLALDMLYAAHRPASRASHVRVYINDQAAGLFLLTEKYTDAWLRREYDHDDPAYANGALYKCKGDVPERHLYADLSYHPENASVYNELYKLDQEAADGGDSGMMPLIDFTKFIDEQLKWQQDNQDNLEDSTDAWEEQLNVQGFLANMALEFLLASWDGYLGNAQNYYLYKEPKTGEMDWIGWDYDFTFGSGTVKMDKMVAGNASEFSGVATRPLMRAVLGIPSYQDTFDAQIDAMNQVFFNARAIFPIIDAWTLFLQQDIAWDQALTPMRAGRSFASMLKHGANGPSLNTMGGGAGMSYPLDYDQGTGADFLFRANTLIPSKAAIDGPTNHPSLMGLKEFILKKSDNINAYYNSTQ